MIIPRTAYQAFRARDNESKVQKAARQAMKDTLLAFLQEWREFANQHMGEKMWPKNVIDGMIGVPEHWHEQNDHAMDSLRVMKDSLSKVMKD